MDPNNVSTVVYQINETLKEDLKNSPKYTVTRLDYTEEMYGDKKKKTFYVDDPSDDKDELVILSFGKDRVVINMAILQGDKITISKKPTPLKFNTLYSDTEKEYKEFKYTPSFKRQISIMTFSILPPHKFLISHSSFFKSLYFLSLTQPKFITTSSSSAPFSIASEASHSLALEVL